MNRPQNLLDTLCYGSIYSHIKNKDTGNLMPDKFAIGRGKRYVMISSLMYINAPIALLHAFHIVNGNFWLIYTAITIAFIFPLGYARLNHQRIDSLCNTYAQATANEIRKADNAWRLFYHLAVIIFFISIFLVLLLP